MTEENAQDAAQTEAPQPTPQPAPPPTEPPPSTPVTPPPAKPIAPTEPPARAAAPTPARSKPRRKRRWLLWSLIMLAVVVLGVGGFIGYRTLTARGAAESKLAEATKLVEGADQIVLDTDEIVRSEIDATSGEEASRLATDVPDAAAALDRAVGMIDEALPDLSEDGRPQAEALKASAAARLEMLELSLPILAATTKAAGAVGPATEAWTLIVDGEKLSDNAVAEYNKLNKNGVENAKKFSKQAQDKLAAGKAQLKIAMNAFPEADMQPYVDYVDSKLASIALSIKADDAYLANKMSDANSYSDKFNAAEKKLGERAKKLPGPPADVVATTYESLAGTQTDAYFKARDTASEADADLKALSN